MLAVSIVLTAAFAAVQGNPSAKITGTSVSVLPANVVWEKTYGVVGDDDRAYCALAADGGYFIVGSHQSNTTGITEGWALMLDQSGNAVWNKTFLEGAGTELRWALNLTDGYLLIGNEFLPSGNIQGLVVRITLDGSSVWSETVGGNGTDEFYSGFAASGGFVLLGLTSQNGGAQSQAWVVKIDANGKVLWNKTFNTASDSVAKSGVLADDGNYMVAGYADTRGSGDYSFLLMKVSPDGSLIWNQTYAQLGSQEATAITAAQDGGYVLVGNTQASGGNMHAWVVKVSSDGALQWARTVGGKNADSPSCITASGDGGYLVGGFTFSFGAGNRDFWLFKVNGSGNVVWSCTQGDPEYQEAYSVISTGKGGCVMVGWTDPPKDPSLVGKARYLFYIVDITYPQPSGGTSTLQLFLYGAVTSDVLLAASLVALNLRRCSKPV
jgi:hypothetical protein